MCDHAKPANGEIENNLSDVKGNRSLFGIFGKVPSKPSVRPQRALRCHHYHHLKHCHQRTEMKQRNDCAEKVTINRHGCA